MGNVELIVGSIIALVIAFFASAYKYKSWKVDSQASEIDDLEQNRDVVSEYIEAKNRALHTEREANDILKSKPPDSIYKLEPNKRHKI